MARTIDNLGVDISNRYAEDQKKLETKLVKDAGIVSTRTEIDVTEPSFPSELELLFESRRKLSWGEFEAPAGFNEQKKRIFTSQIVPTLSDEKKEAQMQRVTAYAPSTHIEGAAAPILPTTEGKEPKFAWEAQKEKDEVEKERKVILTLLNTITTLDKYLTDVNSRRNQYQRG